jgi:hypothetical protein
VKGRTSDAKFLPGVKVEKLNNKTFRIRFDDGANLPFWLEATFKIEQGEQEEEQYMFYQGKLVKVTDDNFDKILEVNTKECVKREEREMRRLYGNSH